jgi:Tfp pilus tip-associated adhesin PilY1
MYHQKLVYTVLARFWLVTALSFTVSAHADPTGTVPIIPPQSHADATPILIDFAGFVSGNGPISYTLLAQHDTDIATGLLTGSTLTVNLVLGGSGSTDFRVLATDDDGSTEFDVTVTSTNQPPDSAGSVTITSADVAQLVEDYSGPPLQLILANAFRDPDGPTDTLTYTLQSNSGDNNFTLSAPAAAVTLTPNADINGSQTLEYRAEDLSGASATFSVVLVVDPVNDEPFLDGDVSDQFMVEDGGPTTVEVLAEFDDIDFTLGAQTDSHTPIVESNDNPGLVTVTVSGSGVELTLTPDQSGVAKIEVGVRDEAGDIARDTFVLTVDPVNDPVEKIGFIPDRLVNEDVGKISISINGVFSDIDLGAGGDSHTVTVVGNTDSALVTPLNPVLSGLTGSFDFAITPEFAGTSVITLEAEDAEGSTASVSFNIEVVGLNDPPFVAMPLTDQAHTEDAGDLTISFAGVFDDPDLLTQGDVQNYDVSVAPSALITSASTSGTNLSLSFGENQNGTIPISITVTDKGGLTATDSFDLVVAPVPDDPYVENPIADIGENEDAANRLLNLDDVFNDADIETNGDVLTYQVLNVSNPTLFDTVDVTGNLLTLDFAANVFGTSLIELEARDQTGTTITTDFNVNVTEIFPTAFDDTASMVEDGDDLVIDVLANDDLGEEPTVIISVGRDWPADAPIYSDVSNSDPTTSFDESGIEVTEPNGYLSVDAGQIVYRPKENFYGVDTFEYTIKDADGDETTATVTVTITGQDDPPRAFTVPEYTVVQGSFLNILEEGGLRSFAVDDDGDSLEVRYTTVPAHSVPGETGFVANADGSFQYTPEPAYGAAFGESDSFQIYYWDEANDVGSDPVTVIINFDPVEADVAEPPSGEVEFDFDLADVPLEDAVAAEANVLVMMDDSGSMDWSVMTPESGGEFRISNAAVRDPGVSSYSRTYRYTARFPTNIYGGDTHVPTEETLAADPVFAGNNYGVWRARNSQYSTVYYNPEIRYTPWIGLDRDGNEFEDASFDAAPLDPFDAVQTLIDLGDPVTFTSYRVPGITQRRKSVTNTNVYLPYYYDTTAVGVPDWNAPRAKIVIGDDPNDGQPVFPITLASGAVVNYYPGGTARADCAADDDDPLTCTLDQEKQNFANWFTYYRSREYSSKAALGRAVSGASNIRMGYAVLNNASERVAIDSLNSSYRVGHKKELMDQVYEIVSNGSTPLRRALDGAGRHFECRSGDAFGSTSSSNPGDPECPILPSPEGQCQNNFTLLFSDGTWNSSFTGANDDGDSAADPSPSPFDGGMFEDTVASSLADVAMYYYERDLHPGLEDGVPTTQRDQDWADISAFQNEGEIMHQHMKTYTIGFGLQGNTQFEDLPLDYTQPFAWGDPFAQGLAKIDDMLHAAVNGRGEFLQANNPVLLSQAFAEAFEDFSDGSVSVSAVAFNSTALREETVEYRGFFNLKYNSGDLRALSVDATDGTVDNANPLWRAAERMDGVDPSTRKIVTWDDQTEQGILFEYASLNDDQRATLNADQLAWLRGDRSDEEPNGILRAREDVEGLLGDIVHSAPQFVGAPRAFRRDQAPYPTSELYSEFAADSSDRQRIVYVAANDGMLHGFDAGADSSDTGTGDEVFAYVPNKIIDSTELYANELSQLTSLVYAHRYFVDLTPSVEDVWMRASRGATQKSWNTLMVGGLAGGGKGYFALNVTDPDSSYATAIDASDAVLWEFTDEDDSYPVDSSGAPLEDGFGNPLLDLTGNPVKDLGYTFAQPQIVMTNAEDLSGDLTGVLMAGKMTKSSRSAPTKV